MQATEATVLLQNLSALNEGFSQLGVRLSQAATALQTTGLPPTKALIEEIHASRHSFAELCAKGIALAESFAVTPVPRPEAIVSLGDLKALLQTLAEAEEKRKAAKELSQQALAILDRLYAIKHRERETFAPLAECQMRATVLRNAIAETPWPKVHPSVEDLTKNDNPFVALLILIEGGEDLDDDQCSRFQDIVERAFSKPLAVAALRGKLMFLSEAVPVREAPAPHSAGTVTASDRTSNKRLTAASAPVSMPASVTREVTSEKQSAVPSAVRNGSSEPVPAPASEKGLPRLFSEGSADRKPFSFAETVLESEPASPASPLTINVSPSNDDPILIPSPPLEGVASATFGKGAKPVDVFYRFEPDDKAQKIANMLLSGAYGLVEEKPAFVRDLVWRLIFEEKLSLAFHVARCLETQYPEFHPRLPSWLLRSVVLGQRVRNPQGDIARFLKEDFVHCDTDCRTTGDKDWDLAVEFLLLGGAFLPALLAPDTRASTILHGVCLGDGLENLAAFCNVIAVYGDLFIPLDPALIKKPGRTQNKESSGFMRRLIGNQEGSGRKDVVAEQTEPLRIEVMNRHPAVLEELNQFRNANTSIPLLGSLACCRRAVENVVLLFDAEAPFSSDEPLPRPLLNADLSRIPTLVLNKQGEAEGADQPAFMDNVFRLVTSGSFKML
jgi:hypothetical protein